MRSVTNAPSGPAPAPGQPQSQVVAIEERRIPSRRGRSTRAVRVQITRRSNGRTRIPSTSLRQRRPRPSRRAVRRLGAEPARGSPPLFPILRSAARRPSTRSSMSSRSKPIATASRAVSTPTRAHREDLRQRHAAAYASSRPAPPPANSQSPARGRHLVPPSTPRRAHRASGAYCRGSPRAPRAAPPRQPRPLHQDTIAAPCPTRWRRSRRAPSGLVSRSFPVAVEIEDVDLVEARHQRPPQPAETSDSPASRDGQKQRNALAVLVDLLLPERRNSHNRSAAISDALPQRLAVHLQIGLLQKPVDRRHLVRECPDHGGCRAPPRRAAFLMCPPRAPPATARPSPETTTAPVLRSRARWSGRAPPAARRRAAGRAPRRTGGP